MNRRAVVIGGGVVGCASALSLARLGWQVELLESGTIGGGCSHGNCGYLCPSHVMPLAVPGAVGNALRQMIRGTGALQVAPRLDPTLARWLWRFWRQCRQDLAEKSARGRHALLTSSRALYDQMFRTEGVEGVIADRGLLLVYPNESEFAAHEKTAKWLKSEFGIATRAVPPEELTTFEPALRPGLGGGWWYEGDAHIDPDHVIDAFRFLAEREGVTFLEHVSVDDVIVEGGRARTVVTNCGEIEADRVILATGAETPLFTRRLGLDLPIQPGKGYSITVRTPERAPQIPLVFEAQHVAVTPFGKTFRIGSTMEFAGYDRTLREERLALLRRSAEEHLIDPGRGPALEEWWGWRPMTPDDLPFIGAHPEVENFFVAAGNGMIGLSSAPATGQLVAELASDVKPHLDPAPYALDRFS